MRVHVLENTAGLLQRDFAQTKPFFDKFDINCSYNLDDDNAQIVLKYTHIATNGTIRRQLRAVACSPTPARPALSVNS